MQPYMNNNNTGRPLSPNSEVCYGTSKQNQSLGPTQQKLHTSRMAVCMHACIHTALTTLPPPACMQPYHHLHACCRTALTTLPPPACMPPSRAVLVDQDVLHRLSPPSRAAGRPRFSLVWKLVFLPKQAGSSTACCLSRPEWGKPACFGSAARLELALQQMAGKKRSSGQLGDS